MWNHPKKIRIIQNNAIKVEKKLEKTALCGPYEQGLRRAFMFEGTSALQPNIANAPIPAGDYYQDTEWSLDQHSFIAQALQQYGCSIASVWLWGEHRYLQSWNHCRTHPSLQRTTEVKYSRPKRLLGHTFSWQEVPRMVWQSAHSCVVGLPTHHFNVEGERLQ